MITKKGLYLIALAYALVLALVIVAGIRDQAKTNVRPKLKLQIQDTQRYQEGFIDGMHATLRHVKLATNVVEIAPILDEMTTNLSSSKFNQ